MKVRIQDHSLRFRITLEELEALGREGVVERTCSPPGQPSLRYAVVVDPMAEESAVRFAAGEIELRLSVADLAVLASPAQEGVYVRREWVEDGRPRRFLAFIEKDRPGSVCEKKEAWIYHGHGGGGDELIPIGGD